MKIPDSHITVIFGASGDLTKRKLIPAVFELYINNLLPANFAILGTSRTSLADEEFRLRMMEFLPVKNNSTEQFLKHIYYQTIDYNVQEEYQKLKIRLDLSTQTTRNSMRRLTKIMMSLWFFRKLLGSRRKMMNQMGISLAMTVVRSCFPRFM